MVAALTFDKKEFFDSKAEMSHIGEKSQKIKDELLSLIDRDTDAFNAIIAANRLPSTSPKEKEDKEFALDEAIKLAIDVPYEIVSCCYKMLSFCADLAKNSSPNSISDVGVAVESAYAGLRGASMNVQINLNDIDDEKYKSVILKDLKSLSQESKKLYEKTINKVFKIIRSNE